MKELEGMMASFLCGIRGVVIQTHITSLKARKKEAFKYAMLNEAGLLTKQIEALEKEFNKVKEELKD